MKFIAHLSRKLKRIQYFVDLISKIAFGFSLDQTDRQVVQQKRNNILTISLNRVEAFFYTSFGFMTRENDQIVADY